MGPSAHARARASWRCPQPRSWHGRGRLRASAPRRAIREQAPQLDRTENEHREEVVGGLSAAATRGGRRGPDQLLREPLEVAEAAVGWKCTWVALLQPAD